MRKTTLILTKVVVKFNEKRIAGRGESGCVLLCDVLITCKIVRRV